MHEYECALTGLTEIGAEPQEGDALGDLPVGWTRVQMTRRQYNPEWVHIQQLKEAMTEGMIQQVPPQLREAQGYAIQLQIKAQFHALEKDTPKYINDLDDVVYISDSGEIVETLNEIREMFGLDEIETGLGLIPESGDVPQPGDTIVSEDEDEEEEDDDFDDDDDDESDDG